MLPVEIPWSTLFIFLLAATISFLMTLVNRLLTDPEKLKAWRKEVAEWYEDFRNARKSGDKKRMEKVMKRQQYIMQLQAKTSWQSMKVTFLFIIPLWIVWFFLGQIYSQLAIAYFPGVGAWLGPFPSLFWWYFLCSYLFHIVFSHLFGLVSTE